MLSVHTQDGKAACTEEDGMVAEGHCFRARLHSECHSFLFSESLVSEFPETGHFEISLYIIYSLCLVMNRVYTEPVDMFIK